MTRIEFKIQKALGLLTWGRLRILAEGNHTNFEVFEELLKVKSVDIKMRIAANPCTPLYILKKLCTARNKQIKYVLMRNPNITGEMFQILSKGSIPYYREALMSHPNIPISILKAFTHDKINSVRVAAFQQLCRRTRGKKFLVGCITGRWKNSSA